MTPQQARAAIEALLFVTDQPLTTKKISEVLALEIETVGRVLREVVDEFHSREGGLMVQRVAGGYRLVTRPEVAAYVERLAQEAPLPPLSPAALEVLAIVAYRQPVTRSEVDAIRGVGSSTTLGGLLDRQLIREEGRKDAPGRPILYGTTTLFLEAFGLDSLEELPGLEGPPHLFSPA